MIFASKLLVPRSEKSAPTCRRRPL